ncbi:MAG TPA: hypothetical protein VK253_05700 [Candidatus Binatia bacterium]|nr:hypothetical protein [Candidatus Binatia bacterium]
MLTCFLSDFGDTHEPRVIGMKKKAQVLELENDLLVDLTFHRVSAFLIAEFVEKIAKPYYCGNLNAAIQDLLHKTIAEQDFIQSHITHIRSDGE